MTFRYLLAATLLAGGVLAAGTAARADTTIYFTGYDLTGTSQVVTGSFSYDPSTLGGATTIGYGNLTAFGIDFPMYPNHSWGLSFVQAPQPLSSFSFNISTDTLANPIFESYADSRAEGFEIYVPNNYISTTIEGEPNPDEPLIGSLTFTPAPEPPAAAVLGVALFGLMLVRRRGGRLRGA